MPDNLSPAERKRTMARVRSRDTTPELVVRRLLHERGYRFRLQRTDLPGAPDIVLPAYGAIVLVHGCFWHQHRCRRGGRPLPVSNREYWERKLARNVQRDRRVRRQLRRLGWRVLVVWECQTAPSKRAALAERLERFLTNRSRMPE